MHSTRHSEPPTLLDPIINPVRTFISSQLSGAIMLCVPAVIALLWANSPWGESYAHFFHTPLALQFGSHKIALSLEHWINDGLMAVFFLLVGLEIKRELLVGELSTRQKAALPIFAALGGMLVPALIYTLLNLRGPGAHGWGIPMATDIAFAMGVLTLVAAMGRSIPVAVKIFLLAIAIVDDLGAVLVIAIFYTAKINLVALCIAGGFLALLILFNISRVGRPLPYIIVGLALWGATLASGLHATIAGVLLAFTIPARRKIDEPTFLLAARSLLRRFEEGIPHDPRKLTDDQSHALSEIEEAAQAVQTPLARLEHELLFPVNFLIVPVFALANAGVNLRESGLSAIQNPIAWGVFLGLFVGKPIGVLLASFIAVKLGIGRLPEGSTRRQLIGVGFLCGIGFTMSLFVAGLAFPGSESKLAAAKVGILGASLLSGIVGGFLLTRKPHKINDITVIIQSFSNLVR